jgi:hypothetical protein
MKLDPAQRAEARQIATELARLARSADVLPGTITERHTRCGKPSCACHHDPPRLHGPYRHWTRKIANKTVGKYLTQHQAHDAQRWIENDRRIRELLARLEQIGIERLETDAPKTRPTRSERRLMP